MTITLIISNVLWILYFKYDIDLNYLQVSIIIDIKDLLLQTVKGNMCVILYINIVNRSNEDIPMQICEPYTLHQSKPTDDAVYDEYQLTDTVYETTLHQFKPTDDAVYDEYQQTDTVYETL